MVSKDRNALTVLVSGSGNKRELNEIADNFYPSFVYPPFLSSTSHTPHLNLESQKTTASETTIYLPN